MAKVPNWLLKLEEIIQDVNTVMLNDTDLFYLVNSKLPKPQQISMKTWLELKSPDQTKPNSLSQRKGMSDEDIERFLNIINVGRVNHKVAMTKKVFGKKTKNVHAYLWALERKNKDLQLNKNLNLGEGNTTINITVGSPEHKGLIDNILEGGTIDIPHEDVMPDLLETKKEDTEDGE